jgi:hypothetical protein
VHLGAHGLAAAEPGQRQGRVDDPDVPADPHLAFLEAGGPYDTW